MHTPLIDMIRTHDKRYRASEDLIDFINKNPAALNERDNEMRTPMMIAVMAGQTGVLELLLKLHPDPVSAVIETDASVCLS